MKKSLYGLKLAPRQWYKKFDSYMGEHGYGKTTSNHCVFVKKFLNGNFILLLLHIVDMLIVGQNVNKINRLKIEFGQVLCYEGLLTRKADPSYENFS